VALLANDPVALLNLRWRLPGTLIIGPLPCSRWPQPDCADAASVTINTGFVQFEWFLRHRWASAVNGGQVAIRWGLIDHRGTDHDGRSSGDRWGLITTGGTDLTGA